MKEIEHRYLLHSLPPQLSSYARDTVETVHCYIVGPLIQERFSRISYIFNRNGKLPATMYRRTVKIGHGLERLEFEEDLPKEIFDSVTSLTTNTWLAKVRCKVEHLIPDAKPIIIEIDRFLDRNLFLAEIEVPSIDSKIVLPEWLQSCVTREVTNEVEFEGANLAK